MAFAQCGFKLAHHNGVSQFFVLLKAFMQRTTRSQLPMLFRFLLWEGICKISTACFYVEMFLMAWLALPQSTKCLLGFRYTQKPNLMTKKYLTFFCIDPKIYGTVTMHKKLELRLRMPWQGRTGWRLWKLHGPVHTAIKLYHAPKYTYNLHLCSACRLCAKTRKLLQSFFFQWTQPTFKMKA